jgi:hypothetical protein
LARGRGKKERGNEEPPQTLPRWSSLLRGRSPSFSSIPLPLAKEGGQAGMDFSPLTPFLQKIKLELKNQ